MFKAILFDADGVLIINAEYFSKTYARANGVALDLMVPFFTGPFLECRNGRMDTEQALAPFLSQWNWDKSAAEFIELWCNTEDNPDTEALELVQMLRTQKVYCCLATDNEQHRTDYIRNAMGFAAQFDAIYSSCEVGIAKESVEFFATVVPAVCRQALCSPEEILFIDDDAKNIAVARAYGLATHHYIGLPDLKEFLAANGHSISLS